MQKSDTKVIGHAVSKSPFCTSTHREGHLPVHGFPLACQMPHYPADSVGLSQTLPYSWSTDSVGLSHTLPYSWSSLSCPPATLHDFPLADLTRIKSWVTYLTVLCINDICIFVFCSLLYYEVLGSGEYDFPYLHLLSLLPETA